MPSLGLDQMRRPPGLGYFEFPVSLLEHETMGVPGGREEKVAR